MFLLNDKNHSRLQFLKLITIDVSSQNLIFTLFRTERVSGTVKPGQFLAIMGASGNLIDTHTFRCGKDYPIEFSLRQRPEQESA
jgi:hypothetical protein